MAKSRARFDLRDLAVALMQYEGIHEGRWQLSVDFSVVRSYVGPDKQGGLPAATMVISGVELNRVDDAPDGTAQVFNAAKENPRRTDKH